MSDSGITRATFRGLIDPLLEGLGLRAEQVVSCHFDADGLTLVLFHLCEQGHRVLGAPVSMPNSAGGVTHFNGFAKVTVHVPVADESSEVAV